MPHRVVILEIEGDERPDLDAAVALQLGDTLLIVAAISSIGRGVEDVGAGDLALGFGRSGHR